MRHKVEFILKFFLKMLFHETVLENMVAPELAAIENSWEVALTVDAIFVELALTSCVLRLVSEIKNGDGRDLADDVIMVACVRYLLKPNPDGRIDFTQTIDFALSALHIWRKKLGSLSVRLLGV